MSEDGSAPEERRPEDEEIPIGQRLFDSPFLLLAACLVILFVFYMGWGLWEIFTLGEAPLP